MSCPTVRGWPWAERGFLDDEARLDIGVQHADVEQCPGREDGERRCAAAKHGGSMVDVGCGCRCCEKHALRGGRFNLYGHRFGQRDVGVEVIL